MNMGMFWCAMDAAMVEAFVACWTAGGAVTGKWWWMGGGG